MAQMLAERKPAMGDPDVRFLTYVGDVEVGGIAPEVEASGRRYHVALATTRSVNESRFGADIVDVILFTQGETHWGDFEGRFTWSDSDPPYGVIIYGDAWDHTARRFTTPDEFPTLPTQVRLGLTQYERLAHLSEREGSIFYKTVGPALVEESLSVPIRAELYEGDTSILGPFGWRDHWKIQEERLAAIRSANRMLPKKKSD